VDEELEGIDYGIIEDPAPYVILQLTDSEETRAIWPHKFELYYKVTAWCESALARPQA
jgi:hypothetical protein